MSCPSTDHIYLFIAIIYKKYYQKEEREKAEGDSQKTDHLRWRWWLMDVYTRTLVPRGKKKSGIHATVEGGGGTGWATSPAEDDEREREREVFDEWAAWVSEPGVLTPADLKGMEAVWRLLSSLIGRGVSIQITIRLNKNNWLDNRDDPVWWGQRHLSLFPSVLCLYISQGFLFKYIFMNSRPCNNTTVSCFF